MNPFVIDSPAPRDELIDREDALATLLELAEGGHNSRLSGPRRYGKTTLLARLGEDADRAGIHFVYVDFFGVLSLADVAARVDRAYAEALKGPLASWFAGVRRKWRIRGRAGVGGTGVELESLPDSEAEDRLHELLALPVEIHQRSGQTTLVAFDEFQEVLTAGNSVDGVIRSRIQHHRSEAAYVFAGSHPGLMAELFGARERPLYGQARQVLLEPLPDQALAGYIDERFTLTGRAVGPALDELLDLAAGHPQRAMLLAHHLWAQTPPGGTAGDGEWDAAVRGSFNELQETFERYWERLSTNERRVLGAVAWTGRWGGGDPLYSRSTQGRFKLTKGSTRDVTAQLARDGDLWPARDGPPLRFVDPLLEAWIASGRRPRL